MKKRVLACSMAVLLALGCAIPARAYELPASYDETYYATLDYYGAPTQASVVKSYRLNGQSAITDYGVYDEVTNLTDDTPGVYADGKVVFTPQAGTEKFYFEGKTTQPFDDLPWRVTISYRLNGAPARAEELAGKTGLVEIEIGVTPNPSAPAYSRDNLILTIATAFNDDDITSLEAPGAEVQLIGNLRAVMFAVLPAEEQDFVIRVGSDSFESAGLILLAVPATLKQLEQVAELREVKEETEDSLEAMDASLDVILNTLDGMSGSLNTAANGLDQLNTARGTVAQRKEDIHAAGDGLHDLDSARAGISAGRDGLSQNMDAALGSLGELSGSLGRLDRYQTVTSQAVEETKTALNDLNGALQGLSPHLKTTRELVVKLQGDTKNLSELLGELDEHNETATRLAGDLAWTLELMNGSVEGLEDDLYKLDRALQLTKGLKPLTLDDLLSALPEEEQKQMREQVLPLHEQYLAYLKSSGLQESQLSFEDFIIAGAYQKFCEKTVQDAVEANAPAAVAQAVEQFAQANGRQPTSEELAAIQAQVVEAITASAKAQLPTLEQFVQAPAAQEYVQQAKAAAQAYDQLASMSPALETVNKKITEVNSVLTNLTGPTGQVVEELYQICHKISISGLEEDATSTAWLCRDLLGTLQAHQGQGETLLGHADELGTLVSQVSQLGDQLLTHTDTLVGLVNTYHPDVQAAITDVGELSTALQNTLNDTAATLTSAKELLDGVWGDLDAGTEKTLNGLSSAMDAMRAAEDDLDGGSKKALSGVSAALRKATGGLAQTPVIRNAKDTIHDLVTDQWDQHSGQVDGLLNMDASATPVSMTSQRNPAPQNVQYIMRTQEIKIQEAEDTARPAAKQKDSRSVWQRIVDMFKDLWHGFIGLFSKN